MGLSADKCDAVVIGVRVATVALAHGLCAACLGEIGHFRPRKSSKLDTVAQLAATGPAFDERT